MIAIKMERDFKITYQEGNVKGKIIFSEADYGNLYLFKYWEKWYNWEKICKGSSVQAVRRL